MNTILLSSNPDQLKKAAELLNQDEVVALPTETVYGLAGNAFSVTAVNKIFAAKERPTFDPLIVHVSSALLHHFKSPVHALIEQEILSSEILTWSCLEKINQAMRKFWPGPLTFVLPRGPKIPDLVTSSQNTVGVRMPAHLVFQSILHETTFPLAAPSANLFGRISPTTAAHVNEELNGKISAIVDGGACRVGVESTIIKVTEIEKAPATKNVGFQVQLLRPGKVSSTELSSLFGVPVTLQKSLGEQNQAQLAPGMLDQHYAPRKPFLLVPHSFNDEAATLDFLKTHAVELGNASKTAIISMRKLPAYLGNQAQLKTLVLSPNNQPEEMAQNLFAALRKFDEDSSVERIIADLPEEHSQGITAAIADRLRRASSNKPS